MPIVPPVLRASTRDLPDVPPLVQFLIGQFLTPILAWLETLVYRPLLRRCADHPLVLLAQWYDPSAVVAACRGFHHAPGTPGAPPTFTIQQFVRIEIVRAWADCCSDPALEQLLSTDILVRWFVGLPLSQPAPDHSTLADFHAYLCAHAPAAFFLDTLTFLDRLDPEPPETTPQIVDTFAMASPVAACRGPAHLLRRLCLRLARCWLASAPPALQYALPPLDLGLLARPCSPRTARERQQHLQTVVSVTAWLVEGLTPHLPALEPALRAVVADYLAALAKVQADELLTDTRGLLSERADKERGSHRLASAVDRFATFRKHGDDAPAVLSTNAVISTTATRIRACVALTGSTPDSAAPAAVLTQQREAGLPLPKGCAWWWRTSRPRRSPPSSGSSSCLGRRPSQSSPTSTR